MVCVYTFCCCTCCCCEYLQCKNHRNNNNYCCCNTFKCWEFLLIVHVKICLLLCLLPSLLWVKLVELLFPNTSPLSMWSLDMTTSFAPTFFLWLPIWIMRIFLMLSLVCLGVINGWVTWWTGWFCCHKGLCSYMWLWCWGSWGLFNHGHMWNMLV